MQAGQDVYFMPQSKIFMKAVEFDISETERKFVRLQRNSL